MSVTDFLQSVVILALWVNGVYYVFNIGLFASVGKGITGLKENFKLFKNIAKPFITCPFCMPSVHGALAGFIFGLSVADTIGMMVCAISASAFINAYIPE